MTAPATSGRVQRTPRSPPLTIARPRSLSLSMPPLLSPHLRPMSAHRQTDTAEDVPVRCPVCVCVCVSVRVRVRVRVRVCVRVRVRVLDYFFFAEGG